jgi:LAO/AO transport system kinase
VSSGGATPPGLAARILAGDVGALARGCRIVDERVAGYRALLAELFPASGHGRVIGITGPPGVGKSTLTDALIAELRRRDERVGVLAIDPTSPFSGGALLGDRIRMLRHSGDAQVFIRSLATRGAHGGLSRSAADVLRLLQAWGATSVLLETVGVGQAELELLGIVQTAVVVVMPGSGDDIQANKAGILEAADVLVLNKADRPGADVAESELRLALALSGVRLSGALPTSHAATSSPLKNDEPGSWTVPIVRSVAPRGEGTAELLLALDAHWAWLQNTAAGRAERAGREQRSLLAFLREVVADAVLAEAAPLIEQLAADVAARALDPYDAVEGLLVAVRQRITKGTPE